MHNLKSYFVKMTFACLFMVFTMYAQKPQLTENDLAVNGESFFAATQINAELSKLAREDGVLTGNKDFHMVAVSGQNIATIINQFKNCNPKPKYLLTDGGGIDLAFGVKCQAGDENCAKIVEIKKTMETYIAEIKKAGVKAFIWTGYPEAPGMTDLTVNQAIWTKVTKKVIAATTEPKAVYVDLLPVFAGHYNEYFPSGDGLHPNPTGSKAAAKAFWDAMKADNYAFFNTGTVSISKQTINNNRVVSGHILSQEMKNGNLSMSLFVGQPSDIKLRLTTASGRSVFTAQRHAAVSGKQDVVFQTGELAQGIYCCEIRTGKQISQSRLLVQ